MLRATLVDQDHDAIRRSDHQILIAIAVQVRTAHGANRGRQLALDNIRRMKLALRTTPKHGQSRVSPRRHIAETVVVEVPHQHARLGLIRDRLRADIIHDARARRGGERHLHAKFPGRHEVPRDISVRLHKGQSQRLAERLIIGGKRHPTELRVTLIFQQSHDFSRRFGNDHVDVHVAVPVDGDHRGDRHVRRRQHRVGADVRVLQLSSSFPDRHSLLR